MTTAEYKQKKEEILNWLSPGSAPHRKDEASTQIDNLIVELIGEDKPTQSTVRHNGLLNVDLTESYNNQFRANLRNIVKGDQ